MRKAIVCGAGGFIGHHLVNYLRDRNYWVCGVDLVLPRYSQTRANEFNICDLRDQSATRALFDSYGYVEEVYQLAADMGGANYIFTGDNDANIMLNSSQINLNVIESCLRCRPGFLFYSSSACIYPEHNQLDPNNPNCAENSAFPANPDSEYGWEKLFCERLLLAAARNHGLNVKIARFHNVFGPEGAWKGGKEKAPSALCRKVALAVDGDEIEIYGDGNQTRSFLYIDECLTGIRLLVDHPTFSGPVNIGSSEMVTINQVAMMIMEISGKCLGIKHIAGPLGVRGRNSDNRLIQKMLNWQPSRPLSHGLKQTYSWICQQIKAETPA